ncbi:MAG: phenylacetate--CoA ligase [Spirochaetes bacterium GWC1_27_15]|nr:MAG: phenylacetate--CoA ligase [Spirochaetes bacterium GWB1_27_13]OHD20972.1 MAG: phenylacetate--CoA ligase [Spirochaetes bacterium GWC1_27_15]
MFIWDTRYETMAQEEIQQFQLEKLQALINRLYLNIPYYKKIFTERNIKPQDIKSLSDIKKIPFMDKDVLRLNQPYGLFALPLREIIRFHSTSGTTGKPIAVGYSKNDINHWAELVARTLNAVGVTNNDVVQIAFEYGMFTGGLGFHYGAEKIGASIIPVSNINPEHQLEIMKNYRTTVLIATPTMALNLANVLEKLNINKNELSLRIGLLGAEPWNEEIRNFIEEKLNIKAYDSYGLSEIIGPGVAFECQYKEGLHLSEDYFYAEIINPETGEVLGEKEEGELVLTTLTKEAFPLLRYRTRDITSISKEKCKCGRTILRIERLKKRTDDVIIINGVKIYPEVLSKIVSEEDSLGDKFEIKVSREEGLDKIEIDVEIKSGSFANVLSDFIKITEVLKSKIRVTYNIESTIKLVESTSLSHIKKRYKITDLR